MPHGGLGIYALDTTGIDGVGRGALEMQILAALETSGGPLLGQTGAAWTMEKTEPYDAPPGSERCSPNPMWGFPRRFLTGFSRLFSWLSELQFSFCPHVRELLSPCTTRGQMHQPSKSTDGMGPAVRGPPGVPRGRSARRLSQVPRATAREAGRGEASGEGPGHQVREKLGRGSSSPHRAGGRLAATIPYAVGEVPFASLQEGTGRNS